MTTPLTDPEGAAWNAFLESGMLWLVNRTLHIFGWSIVLVVEDSGKITQAYPARTQWKGFPPEVNDQGYQRVEVWMNKIAREAVMLKKSNNDTSD